MFKCKLSLSKGGENLQNSPWTVMSTNGVEASKVTFVMPTVLTHLICWTQLNGYTWEAHSMVEAVPYSHTLCFWVSSLLFHGDTCAINQSLRYNALPGLFHIHLDEVLSCGPKRPAKRHAGMNT